MMTPHGLADFTHPHANPPPSMGREHDGIGAVRLGR
jgi:hypothetical protein